jgi:hypothetical protein
MDLSEIYHELADLLDEKVRLGVYGDDEMIMQQFPDYYKKVMNLVYKLGTETRINGHSVLLDEFKERAYKLIGL